MTYILDTDTILAADLDGTLTTSKSPLTEEMATTITEWLETRRFAVISGGSFKQIQLQVLSLLPAKARLENLYLYPTNGSVGYAYKNKEWEKMYEEILTNEEAHVIKKALVEVLTALNIPSHIDNDEIIEFRGSQVTFSGLGQHADYAIKSTWDPDQKKRQAIVALLKPLLPNYAISIGGSTSIDITKKGIDKAFAIKKMQEVLGVDIDHIIFLGDALFEGGNDWSVSTTGATCIKVNSPEDSIREINQILQN